MINIYNQFKVEAIGHIIHIKMYVWGHYPFEPYRI